MDPTKPHHSKKITSVQLIYLFIYLFTSSRAGLKAQASARRGLAIVPTRTLAKIMPRFSTVRHLSWETSVGNPDHGSDPCPPDTSGACALEYSVARSRESEG